MKLYGLIGHPLGHSFSKSYFDNKFEREGLDCKFANFDIDRLDDLRELINSYPDLHGFTVTYPYKKQIINYIDFIDGNAKEIGAVNVVNIGHNRSLTGYNTDYIGFKGLLKVAMNGKKVSDAIVCGNGGASKAVQYVLTNENIDYEIVTRHPQDNNHLSYSQLKKYGFHDNELIINTTPLGMTPNLNECIDIPYDTISSSNIMIDLIYNPEETLFLAKGMLRGADTFNGLRMLYLQADAAWEIWNRQ